MAPPSIPVLQNGPAVPGRGGCSAGRCGAPADRLDHLPEHIRRKVFDHPCYSEQAHHHFARMHVAVAPACNIQCHYCNRKYDCANESRPGVVSEVLSPEEAVRKVLAVAAAIPQLTVVGIAGPGDALANPERTFATFRLLRERAPDIKLCVSTNGLNLPACVDALVRYEVEHVTITINCVDPDVGARIYPWVFWNHRRMRGRAAARILVEQQQRGLEMLTARGVLVKVNSVLIPGVNDAHLPEVARVVKAKGAFLHNVMPLIAEPEHGTYYGLTGQRGPTHEELQRLQDSCAGDMRMMRHCRQCRADAVGLLGEDRRREFSRERVAGMEVDYPRAMERRAAVHTALVRELERVDSSSGTPVEAVGSAATSKAAPRPVLMAVATKGGGLVNEHFGHAGEFLVYEASATGVRFIGHRRAAPFCTGADSCGEGEEVLAKTIAALAGCEVVLCARVGFEPWGALEAAGIRPNGEHAMEPIEAAVQAVYAELRAAGELDAEPRRAEVA